jgi:hypothetical protein
MFIPAFCTKWTYNIEVMSVYLPLNLPNGSLPNQLIDLNALLHGIATLKYYHVCWLLFLLA